MGEPYSQIVFNIKINFKLVDFKTSNN